jgi:N-dimethylarginine dimethylaminohydrolase
MERKPKLYVIRDSAVVLDRRAVTCHFIHSTRRGEEQVVKKRLKELGIKIAGHIFAPGFLQGSDLFFTDKTHAFAVVGERTNVEGIKHLMEILKIDITPIKMEGLANTQFNILNDIAVMSEEVVYQPVYKILKDNGFDILLADKEQTKEMGVNFLQIDDNKIVNARSSINKKLRMIGFDVIEVEIRELAKGNCGVRNMCLPFY